MKRYFTLLIVFAVSIFSLMVSAQDADYKGRAKVMIDEIKKEGDSLVLRMNIDVDGTLTRRDESLILIPYLKAEQGTQSIILPQVVINGKINQRLYKRTLTLDPESKDRMSGITVVGTDKDNATNIYYRVSTPYMSWMDNSVVNLQEELSGCNGERSLISVSTLANFTYQEPAPPVVIASAPQPPKTTVVEYEKEGSAYIDFVVGKYDLRPDFRNNQYELGKIEETIRSITQNDDAEITGIYLTGFASPEGTYEFNQILSMNRAESVKTYLINKYHYPASIYHTSWGGEDWAGLRKLVEDSDMPQKSAIIDIIDNVDIFAGREKRLMNLDNGNPYRYMLQNFFPQLRRVHYRVTYKYKDEITVE
ncbi:MAG: DUF3868 domain-containing protein [Rikenellaceae bacterium]|nr:DUF3868 domain-containing protein [Rikenellaceae bacterium]